MQSSNNSRDGSKQDKQRRQWQHTRRQGRTCTLPTNRREATMDDVHKAGLELCNKGTSTFLTTTNILGHEENEAHTTVSTRNKGLQVHTTPDDNSGRQRHTNTWRLRRCRLGRLHNNKEIHNRIRNQVLRSNNPFRIKDTSNRSTIKCRIGTVLNRNGSTRITPHPQFLDGNNTDKQTIAHKRWMCPTMLDNAKWTTFNVVTAYNSSRSLHLTSMSFPIWKRTIYASWVWISTQQWSSIHTVGTMTLCGILDMQSISKASSYNGRLSVTMRRTISCATQSCVCAWIIWAWKAQATSQWRYKRWSNNSGSTIAWTPTMWRDNWSHNVDTEITNNGSLTHKSRLKRSMRMAMAMATMMTMPWEDQGRGRLTIEINNVNKIQQRQDEQAAQSARWDLRHPQYRTTSRTAKMYCNNGSWTMHEPFCTDDNLDFDKLLNKTMLLEWFCLTIWIDNLFQQLLLLISRVFENNAVLQQSEGRC